MSAQRRCLLITTLAEYQTDFWKPVAEILRAQGHAVAFVSFDDRSTAMLRAAGIRTFGVSDPQPPIDTSDAAFLRAVHEHGIDHPNLWLSHERYTFALRDSAALQAKFLRYLALAGNACDALRAEGHEVVLVQELGGFVSVIASYFAARRRNIDNWFIEPSFFRGRLFFLRNTFRAASIPAQIADRVSPEVERYLAQTLDQQSIVIPLKDKHQYTTAARKILNRRNARRLLQKLIDKHLLGKHQEFGHIGRHVSVHARMLANSLRLRGHYTTLEQAGRFIYYPLHVPADMALTLRSPQYVDQLALIEYVLRAAPPTHRIAIKEHPAMIGAIDAPRLLALMQRFDNLLLLPPSTNNFNVLKKCDLVVSVNSKSGAEAMLLGKPVIVLGDAFYRASPLATPVERIDELPATIDQQLTRTGEPKRDVIAGWFEQVWRQSLVGELYVPAPENVARFASSMLAALQVAAETPSRALLQPA